MFLFHTFRSASPTSDRENNGDGINLGIISLLESLKKNENNNETVNIYLFIFFYFKLVKYNQL